MIETKTKKKFQKKGVLFERERERERERVVSVHELFILLLFFIAWSIV